MGYYVDKTLLSSFFGNSIGMVALPRWPHKPTGHFCSPVDGPTDMAHREVWVRVAEVFDGLSIPAGATGFELGLEDDQNTVVWVDSNKVGGVPRPYNWTYYIKTMLKTLRFPDSYFVAVDPQFNIGGVTAILIRLNRGDRRALAFDDLQIVPGLKRNEEPNDI